MRSVGGRLLSQSVEVQQAQVLFAVLYSDSSSGSRRASEKPEK